MRLKEARLSAGLTQEEAASALHVGRTTVTMWETGAVNPTADKLPAIARLYGCTINDLFKEEKQEA